MSMITAAVRDTTRVIKEAPDLPQSVSNLLKELADMKALKRDLQYLKSCGIPITSIAEQIGLTRRTLHYWMANQKRAKDSYYILIIKLWAQEQRKLQEQPLELQPHVSVSSNYVSLSQLQ